MTKYKHTLSRDDDGTLRPSPGCDIFTAATLAIAWAKDMNMTEKLTFNGVVLYIDAFSDPTRVTDEYHMRLRHQGEQEKAAREREAMLNWEIKHAPTRAHLIRMLRLKPEQARLLATYIRGVLEGRADITEAEYVFSRLGAEIDPGL